MVLPNNPKDSVRIFIALVLAALAVSFLLNLRPVSSNQELRPFDVVKGEGVDEITAHLHEQGFIRSPVSFKFLLFMTVSARDLKPGIYALSQNLSSLRILNILARGERWEATVTIPEGSTIYDIDAILSKKLITTPGAFVKYAVMYRLEGKLFPDTYNFYIHSDVTDVALKLLRNFNEKASPLLKDNLKEDETLILASLVQNEVPIPEDQAIVAGILKKRFKAGMPLQVDASICYIKEMRLTTSTPNSCYPLTPLDFAAESPYNTYVYKGWPPGPISSPGLLAVQAALHPKESPYWYYLSDPRTEKTIFSVTYDEHKVNRATYLK